MVCRFPLFGLAQRNGLVCRALLGQGAAFCLFRRRLLGLSSACVQRAQRSLALSQFVCFLFRACIGLRASQCGLPGFFLDTLAHACRFDGVFMRSGRGLRGALGCRLGGNACGGFLRKTDFRGVTFKCRRFCAVLGLEAGFGDAARFGFRLGPASGC